MIFALCGVSALSAQTSPPRLTQVQPAGAQKGATLDLVVSGQFLDNAETLHFDFPGVKVQLAGDSEKVTIKPNPKQKGGMKGPVAQTAQRFKVTLPADAPLGIHDVRVVTKLGISNPRAFVVGDLKEAAEKESNDDVDKAQKVDLNTTVNGIVLSPTDVDYYAFTGKKGQRIVISCLTTSIDSKLPAQLQLYGNDGKYLGVSRAYANDDAVLDATLPADGEYLLRLSSFTYTQGGADYFYRVTIGTGPWIDAVSPLAVEPGKETKVTVWGRNLPGGVPDPSAQVDGRTLDKITVTVKAPTDPQKLQRLDYSGVNLPLAAALDGMELRVKNDVGSSNPFLLTYASSPVVLDAGGNESPEKAQKLTLPCEVSGRIEKKGDRDWYSFTLKKGETIRIDVRGERIGSPIDLFFQVRDEKGKMFPEQDENPDITSNLFYTRSEDPPAYKFTAPSDGVYSLLITSREAVSSAGPRHFYLARIGRDDPDFHLIAMPAANTPEGVTLGQGGRQAWVVFAFREGGFTGDIALSGEALPPGISMPPQKIAFGQKTAAFVIGAAPEAPPTIASLKVVGTASIGGKKIVREVRGASIIFPGPANVNNVILISRMDREMVLAVRGQAPYAVAADKPTITVIQGEKINIPVKMTPIRADFKLPVQVLVLNPPPGLVSQNVTLSNDKKSGTVALDSKTPPAPGVYTLVLRGQTTILTKGAPPKGPQPPNLVEASLPVTLIIVPKQLAKLAVDKNLKVSLSKKNELTVRVDRLFDFPGEFKVEIVPSKKEIAPASGTIKEGQDETNIPLTIASGAKVGTTVQATVRATAMFNGVPIIHEVKNVNLVVSK